MCVCVCPTTSVFCVQVVSPMSPRPSHLCPPCISIVLHVCLSSGHALKYASNALACDKEVAMAAIEGCGGALTHCCEKLKADKDVVCSPLCVCHLLFHDQSCTHVSESERVVTAETSKQSIKSP